MSILIILLVALAPCVFWLWLIYLWDRYKPEPKWLIIRTFLIGLAIGIPVAFIETTLYPNTTLEPTSLQAAAYLAFIVAGFTEEGAKFLVVRRTVYYSRHFEEPADGLVYSAAAALGFASLENIVYVISFGFEVILLRALFSNLAHVLFSSLWGYPMALSKLGMLKTRYAYFGLAAAIAAHGLFDFLLFTNSVATWLVIPLFFGMAFFFVLMMRHANRYAVYVAHRMGQINPKS